MWHKLPTPTPFLILKGRITILKGRITIHMKDGDVTLGPGGLFVVPKGVAHCPRADEEAHLLLIEPSGTPQHRRSCNGRRRRVA